MHTPPACELSDLKAEIESAFDLAVTSLEPLPWGADSDSFLFRLQTAAEIYFLKLRSGAFEEAILDVPAHLDQNSVNSVISPILTAAGTLFSEFGPYKVMLFPFIAGKNGYEIGLTRPQWHQFGTVIKQLHTLPFPPELVKQVKRERFDQHWHTRLGRQLEQVDTAKPQDELDRRFIDFISSTRSEFEFLLRRVHALSPSAKAQELVLCHADLHAGNLLISTEGELYVVDWDTLILAPKERDLMYIGGGLLGQFLSPHDEDELFFAGYGEVDLDLPLISYYRYSRIIEDLALYWDEILHSDLPMADRELAFSRVQSNFYSNGTIAAAKRVDIY